MSELRFQTLGSVDLRDSAGRSLDAVLAQPKRVAFLAYLAIEAHGDYVRRDGLVGLFWPELDERHARQNLRQTLHELRRAVHADLFETRGNQEVGLQATVVDCDTSRFRSAIEGGRSREALDLYGGEFLDGFHLSDGRAFSGWLDRTRERLRHLAVEAASDLVERARTEGEPLATLSSIRRARALSPYDEGLLRQQIELLADAGRRADAIVEYQQFAGRLHDDLGVEPSPETRGLIEAISRDDGSETGESDDRPARSSAARAPTKVVNPTIVEAAPESQGSSGDGGAEAERDRRGRKRAVAASATLTGGLVIALLFVLGLATPATEDRVSNRVRLTAEGDVRVSSLSPDGQFLAYAAGESGDVRLEVLDLATRRKRHVTTAAGILTVEWSPDGGHLLWTVLEDDERYRGYVAPRIGGEPRQLTAGPRATWDASGERVISWWMARRALYLTDIETGEVTHVELPMEVEVIRSADGAPRSNRAVVLTESNSGPLNSLWIVDLETRASSLVWEDDEPVQSPRWSPDEAAIYFLRDMELWRARLARSGAAEVTPLEGGITAPSGEAVNVISISLGGAALSYVAAVQYSNLWAVELGPEGVEARALTEGTSFNRLAGVSSDGRRLVYVQRGPGSSQVLERVLDLEGDQRVTFGTGVLAAALDPLGRRLALLDSDQHGMRLRVLDLEGGGGSTLPALGIDHVDPGVRWSGPDEVLVREAGGENWRRLTLDANAEPSPLLSSRHGYIINPVATSDGSRFAFLGSNTSGLDVGPGLWTVSDRRPEPLRVSSGYRFPIGWSDDGRTLFYLDKGERRIFAWQSGTDRHEVVGTVPFVPGRCLVVPRTDGRRFVCEVPEALSDVWLVEGFDRLGG